MVFLWDVVDFNRRFNVLKGDISSILVGFRGRFMSHDMTCNLCVTCPMLRHVPLVCPMTCPNQQIINGVMNFTGEVKPRVVAVV